MVSLWQPDGSIIRSNGVNTGSTLWSQDASTVKTILDTRHDAHDENIADSIEECINRGGLNTPTADLPMGTRKHTNVGNATARNQYASYAQVQDSSPMWGGTATGAANTYNITLPIAITSYISGLTVRFISATRTTGASTLSVNGLPAKALRIRSEVASYADLLYSDIDIGDCVEATYFDNGSEQIFIVNNAVSRPRYDHNGIWTPAYQGSAQGVGALTLSSTSTSIAKYAKCGDFTKIKLVFTTTLTGTGDYFGITLPSALPTNSTANFMSGMFFDAGASKYIQCFTTYGSSTSIHARRCDGAVFTSGSVHSFTLIGEYENS